MLAPWKTASSTLHERLVPYNESIYSRFYYFSPFLNRVVHQHITCTEFAAYPESTRDYLVASFVRNPYDRVYSGFIQLQRDIREQPDAPFPAEWVRALVVRQLTENLDQLRRADFDFDRWVDSVTEYQVFEVGRNSSFPLHPGHYWTHVVGQEYARFIGRVESFEADLDRFCREVGIEVPERRNQNVSEGGLGRSNGAYRYASRMARRSIDKINALFEQDFDLFGYERL
ncbi:MAG TPA: sulfotransferase family 2 domain-containing protein [Acetobacteraceae bacterium]|nr:sulfotransferase family 2 domain-containing protein [Acetobacteraceae bacterium]